MTAQVHAFQYFLEGKTRENRFMVNSLYNFQRRPLATQTKKDFFRKGLDVLNPDRIIRVLYKDILSWRYDEIFHSSRNARQR